MRFRPCIDIHNGQVKQIVGGSLQDEGDWAATNYTAAKDAAYYARLYQRDQLLGGHIILLNPATSSYFEATRKQALSALHAYPGGLQIGGGINPDNAGEYLEAGASHVIVTSYVFRDGEVKWEHLDELVRVVGKQQIVLDLSCRKRADEYYIVTNRWQTFTKVPLDHSLLDQLAQYCSEFLIHGVDVEGKQSGIEIDLVHLLRDWGKGTITYAGGIASLEDLSIFGQESDQRLDFTIGSALDLFGGTLAYDQIKRLNMGEKRL